MSEQQTQGEHRDHWWGVLWPRASRGCSLGSRALSVLGAPVALFVGVLLAIGLMIALPVIAAVFLIGDRAIGGPQLTADDDRAR